MEKLFDNIYKDRKVLITGHTGFKGSWLCLLLSRLGADVYGYALEPHTNPSLFNEAKINDLITSFIGDIRDYEKLLGIVQRVQPVHLSTCIVNCLSSVHLLAGQTRSKICASYSSLK